MTARCATLLLIALSVGPWLAVGAAEPASDWDWSAFGGLDDAPVTGRPPSAPPPVPAEPAAPRRAAQAAPDLAATPRQAYALFADLPPFEVIPAERDAEMHPCSNCHQWALSDPKPRKLKEPHDNFDLEHGLHGKGKFWCFTCHDLSGAGGLKTLEGDKLDFADAYLLCSQCHVDQARDWAYGAHGKRVSGWQGKRQVLNCTACHYQHRPGLKARAPQPGPVVRMGLERPAHWTAQQATQRSQVHGYETLWNGAHREAQGAAAQGASGDRHKSPRGVDGG